MDELNWNSYVVRGQIVTAPEYYYEIPDCTYYKFDVRIESKNEPLLIPMYISDQICNVSDFQVGKHLFAKGTLQSERIVKSISDYYQTEDKLHNPLISFMEIRKYEFISEGYKPLNNIIIDGHICTKMKAADVNGNHCLKVLIASNRGNESCYIWCSFLGRRAIQINRLQKGDCLRVMGGLRYREDNENNEISESQYIIHSTWTNKTDRGFMNRAGYYFEGIEKGAN